LDSRIIAELQQIVGSTHVLTEPRQLLVYSYDATFQPGRAEVVVLPHTAAEVSAVLRLANRHGLPVTPRGAGTGLSGGSLPMGGIALVLTRMNRILELDAADRLAVVEPGVVTADLQTQAEALGLFYPPDPGSQKVSTLGGNVAENAGGPRCLKYGVTRDYVLGLEVVTPTGEIIRTGGRTVKNVSGYDLTRLLVGSEGTLGVVTQIILRLIPRPEAFRTAMAVFPRLDDASTAVARIMAAGITPTALEIVDQYALKAVENYLHIGLPIEAEAVLVVEVDGFAESVDRQLRTATAVCSECGAGEVRVATTAAERDELWVARRSVSTAITQIAPTKIGEDITVPPSQVPEMIRKLQWLRQKLGLPMVVFGHAGDGNLHPNFVVDGRDPAQLQKVEAALAEISRLALGLGGTLSGEHGIGTLKAPFLDWEAGAEGIEVMRRIKRALDPGNILNPGKMRLDEAIAPAPQGEHHG